MTDSLEPTTPNTPGTTRRQSCDRCHGQKLRCTRSGNRNTGACNRCLRQGAPCIYSFSLPKGRPSMYRAVQGPREEQRPAAALEPPTMSLDPVSCASPQCVSHPLPAAASTQNNQKEPISDTWKRSNQIDPVCDQDNPTSTNVDESPAGLWTEIETFGWGDMGMELGNSGQGRSIYSRNHTQPSMNHLFGESYPTDFNFDGETINESITFSNSSSSIIGLCQHKPTPGPEASIAQLSTLSTRLYPLQKSSSELIAAQQSSSRNEPIDTTQTVTLIDDAAFQLLASWLVRASSNMTMEIPEHCTMSGTATSGSILPDVFCSSRQLMGILRSLQVNTGFSSDRTPSSASRSPDSIIEIGMNRTSNEVRASTQGSDTVVRHLIIACHTLLLSIYIAVLTALKNDIHLTGSSHRGFDDLNFGIRRDAGLKDMRWIVIVQVCSYLIERQCNMVDAHLNTRPSPAASELSSDGSGYSPSTPAGREEMNELEMEVKQRIMQFRQFLRM